MLALIPVFPLLGFLINGVLYLASQPKRPKVAHGGHGHDHTHDHGNGHHDGHAAHSGHADGHGHGEHGHHPPWVSAGFSGTIATLSIFSSFVVSLMLFLELHGMGEHRVLEQTLFSWIHVGNFNVDLGFRVDSLSTLFTLVITGVGTLIHLYSIGYMSHDASPAKFFAYLNLFCFAMLMLVLGSSLPVLFLGWEGVGLCSYLLIGFWYTDMEKAKAGKKAFVVNRVGDFGFLLGMFLIYTTFGTLDFAALQTAVQGTTASPDVITLICLFLFVGCMGKSAQFPLYVWLPDAMAGPTPVSALIHAATMVTSGIYLVTRVNFLYSMSPTAMAVVATVGGVTAFFSATIAIAQKDIKKVLAYSTVSQLGYMFLACGVGAYTAGVFHVITHAFFKALLFLGAGSVIHGMHEEQNIFRMGGLSSKMPKTYITFAMGWLAICGIVPFAGFFSKDEILWMTFSSSHGSVVLWGLGLLTAMMTAFYMTRLFVLTFLGTPRHQGPGSKPVHESPWVMTLPLQVLAVLSLVGGWIGIPHMSWIEHWLEPVIMPMAHEVEAAGIMEWVLMGLSLAGAGLGIFAGFKVYSNLTGVAALEKRFSVLHRLLENKWYVDEFYEAVAVRPIRAASQFLWKAFDVGVIDRMVLGVGRLSQWTGQTTRVIQTGSIQIYALVLMVGVIAIAGFLIYGWV